MNSEFILLDAKLSEKAKNLQLAEEQIWRNWCLWQNTVFDGSIKYPMAFHIRDKNLDMDLLEKAARIQRDSMSASSDIKDIMNKKTKEILAKDEDELEEFNKIKVQPIDPISNETQPPQN